MSSHQAFSSALSRDACVPSRIFLGPMSQNVVDAVIEYSNSFEWPVTLIPSRRQVEYTKGYVNNWSTQDFAQYVKNRSKHVCIERDHGGPGQGFIDDDGVNSFAHDCKHFDVIHIDPWKKYPDYSDGLNHTVDAILQCHLANPHILFEIATEESIRRFEVDELERLILDLQTRLPPTAYSRIKFLVIQCGTGLCEGENVGSYSSLRLQQMVNLCKKYNLTSKEHNGDWVPISLMKEKFDKGLDCINVAPEMGQLETEVVLECIRNHPDVTMKDTLFEKFYEVCYESERWRKWVTKDFEPDKNKEKLILICGHYVFSCPQFEEITRNLSGVKHAIRARLLAKLREYHSLHDSFYKVIIPTSGVGSRLGNLTWYTNKALVKVGDKLAICHIIEKYNELLEYVILLGYYGDHVKEFLQMAYPNHCFRFVWVDNYDGPNSSLAYSLLQSRSVLQCPFMFHCCDSVTQDSINIPEQNTLFVHNHKNGTIYATINTSDNRCVKMLNKKGELNFDYTYTGIAFIKDYSTYWSSLNKAYYSNSENKEVGDVDAIRMILYENKGAFLYQILDTWYDSGNLTQIEELIKTAFKCKYDVLDKNNESICFFDEYVIKFFYDSEIARRRVVRGNNLYPLTPRILAYEKHFIKMELVNGNLMSNIVSHGEIKKLLEWSCTNLWKVSSEPYHYDKTNFYDTCKSFYCDKTRQRIDKMLIHVDDLSLINNTETGTIHSLLEQIDFDLLCTTTPTQFHGDFILDNIIKTDDGYKLIDWRQDFGNDLLRGDIYYDLGKLRHNIILNHSNVLDKLYNLHIRDNQVCIDLKCNYTLMNQMNDLDKFIESNGLDLKKVRLITSLIWLNMSPLHIYPLNAFLYYFGKYNLYLELSK